MPESNETLLKLVNASGFAFQLRVEQQVKTTHSQTGWAVVATEHRWFDSQEANEGFIDLVLCKGFGRMVVECKRVTEGNWIFLVENDGTLVPRTRLLWTLRASADKFVSDWHDFYVTPTSAQSTFCVVRGQGEKDTPMLERLSSLLLRSVGSLASEEFNYTERSDGAVCLYFPVIVTNATLHVCRIDPDRIDLLTGLMDYADFEQVPWVRFRKNFSSSISSPTPQRNLQATNRENERSVIVVNSAQLSEFLSQLQVPYNEFNAPWPWEGIH